MRMIQTRNGARFSFESLPQILASSDVRWQHLDRDCPIEPCVAGLVDLAHPTRADGATIS